MGSRGIKVTPDEYAKIAHNIATYPNKVERGHVFTDNYYYLCTNISDDGYFNIIAQLPIEGNEELINKLRGKDGRRNFKALERTEDIASTIKEIKRRGGRIFINTRKAGEEKHIKDKIELDSPQEVLVKRNGRIASYQRFFTPAELREWVQQELGEGYTVEIANKANSGTNGLAAVVVTKNNESPTNRGKAFESGQPVSNHKGMANASLTNVATKVDKNTQRANRLDKIISSIKEIGEMGSHEFLHEVVNAMMLSNNVSTDVSRYAILGGGVTLRLADHYGNASNFKGRKDEIYNYGLVVKLTSKAFIPDKDIDYLEYVYFPDKLNKERQLEILTGLKGFIETGRFDLLPTPDKVHPSGKFANLNTTRFRSTSPIDTARQVASQDIPRRIEQRTAALAQELGVPITVLHSNDQLRPLGDDYNYLADWLDGNIDGRPHRMAGMFSQTDNRLFVFAHNIIGTADPLAQLESTTHQAAVRLTWNNEKKNWLLTAFEKKNSASDNTTDTGETSLRGKQNDTATLQNTVSNSKDTTSSPISNNLQQKIAQAEVIIVYTRCQCWMLFVLFFFYPFYQGCGYMTISVGIFV